MEADPVKMRSQCLYPAGMANFETGILIAGPSLKYIQLYDFDFP